MAIPLTRRAQLQRGEAIDLAPSLHWPEPLLAVDDPAERSPVMITVEYRIEAADVPQFLAAIEQLGQARQRGGAYAWSVLQDAADPARFIESFMETSWLQHLRHHERVTGADQVVQQRVNALHRGTADPVVTHLLGYAATT